MITLEQKTDMLQKSESGYFIPGIYHSLNHNDHHRLAYVHVKRNCGSRSRVSLFTDTSRTSWLVPEWLEVNAMVRCTVRLRITPDEAQVYAKNNYCVEHIDAENQVTYYGRDFSNRGFRRANNTTEQVPTEVICLTSDYVKFPTTCLPTTGCFNLLIPEGFKVKPYAELTRSAFEC